MIVPSGSGRPAMDQVEARVVAEVLGDARPSWFCPSAYIGAPEAALGPLGLASAVLALERGRVPAALNSSEPIDPWPLAARPHCTEEAPRTAWVSGFSSEGVAGSVVLRGV